MKNNPLVIFCSFLPLNQEYKSLWNKINQSLKNKNIDFLLLTASDGYDDLEFPVIKIPFSLKGFDESFSFELSNHPPSEEEIHLIERDINWINEDLDEYDKFLNGLEKCKLFYQYLVDKLKPSFVFVWGHYLPQSIIFKNILEKKNVPVHCLERGFYSGTLMIEDLLYSETDNPDFFNSAEKEENIFDNLKEYYLNNSQSKYPENHDFELEDLLINKIKSGYKLITIFGSHDVPLFPRENSLSQSLSPVFQSTLDFTIKLKALSNFENIIFLLKPHPNDKTDYSIVEDENLFVSKSFFNRRLFEISDVLIFGNTTLQFEALFYDKPLILYAKSSLMFSQGIYSINNSNEMETVLKAAINKEYFDVKLFHLKSSLNKILTSYIYFYNDFNLLKNLSNLIEFIESKIISEEEIRALPDRLKEFEDLIFIKRVLSDYKKNNYHPSLIIYPNHFNTELDINNLKLILTEKLKRFYFQEENSPIKKLLIKAEEFISNQNYEDAENILTKLQNNKETKVDALNDLAYIEIERGNYQKAIDYIIEVLKIHPSEEIANNNLNYLLENNLIEAIEVKRKIKNELFPKLILNKICSYNEFISYNNQMKDEYSKRLIFEKSLLPNDESKFNYKGICFVCSDKSDFIVDFWNAYQTDKGKIPNWRERLVCPKCNLNNRMRLTYHLLNELTPNFSNLSVYITEQTTPLYSYLKNINPNLIGSEYLGNKFEFGKTTLDGILNEDLTNLTFDNEKFDLLISLDVLEHIPDYRKALKECYRVLKRNGKVFFSFPFNKNSIENVIRAKLNQDGSIQHILPPEYHGDPLNIPEGCLCFYHFGWQILDDLKNAGFENSYIVLTYSKEFGYLGGEQMFFIAEKGAQ